MTREEEEKLGQVIFAQGQGRHKMPSRGRTGDEVGEQRHQEVGAFLLQLWGTCSILGLYPSLPTSPYNSL